MDSIMREGKDKLFNTSFRTDSSVMQTEAKAAARSGADLRIEKISLAIGRTQHYFLSRQHEEGYWWFELESNVTITAEYLMLLHFLGIRDEERDRKVALHILRNQRSDGSWAIHWGGKGDLSTSIEAYFALKMAGHAADEECLRKAKKFILEQGGVEKARVFTHIFLALFGEFDWKDIPSVPVELNLVPKWFPLNIYNFSSWARSTFVPLSLVLDLKPVRPVPESARIAELYENRRGHRRAAGKRPPFFSWKRLFSLSDRFIKATEDSPLRRLRQRARAHTEKWLLDHQEPTGDWGGIQPAMVNSVLALAVSGYEVTSDPVRKGLEALERFTIERNGELLLQSCISPVWDTALTSLALLDSGLDRNHSALMQSGAWLASKQIFRKGDWSVKRPGLEPGGWAFEFENGWYPDVDDTAVVLLFLYRFAEKDFISEGNLQKGLKWVLGMQGRDGGWGAFDVDNDLRILNQLPFGDLEAMIDPSTPDLTGRVLGLLGSLGFSRDDAVVRKAIRFLRKAQERDGSWWGRWGVNYLYGTSLVLSGLAALGEDMTKPYVRNAVVWLKSCQNPDWGWGECCESYADCALKTKGASTASQTAWTLLGLIAAGEEDSIEAREGIKYLLRNQKADGTWDEERYTGTGFPKYFMLKYHNYRNCFPLMALGIFRSKALRRGLGT